jgi:hypothetical protein
MITVEGITSVLLMQQQVAKITSTVSAQCVSAVLLCQLCHTVVTSAAGLLFD